MPLFFYIFHKSLICEMYMNSFCNQKLTYFTILLTIPVKTCALSHVFNTTFVTVGQFPCNLLLVGYLRRNVNMHKF